MAFTFPNWLDSPSPPAASTIPCGGLQTAAFHLQWFPITQQDPSVNRHRLFHFLVAYYMVVFLGHQSPLRQCSKISAFWPVHNLFQYSWETGFSHSGPLCNQCYPLAPCSAGCWLHDILKGYFLWTSSMTQAIMGQKDTCFCSKNFWGGSNLLRGC